MLKFECPKCGCDSCTVRYQITDELKITCIRCGYQWTEKPLDER